MDDTKPNTTMTLKHSVQESKRELCIHTVNRKNVFELECLYVIVVFDDTVKEELIQCIRNICPRPCHNITVN